MTKEDLKECILSLFDNYNYTALSTNALFCSIDDVSKDFVEKTLEEMYYDGIVNKVVLSRHLPNKEVFVKYWVLSHNERNIFDADIWNKE